MSIWFTPDKIFSYNALLNFCVGQRGCGKTYGTKKWAIKRFIKTGKKFIYLRRYKEEIKDLDKFFDTLSQDEELSIHDLTVRGRRFYVDGEECGQAMILSTYQSKKGVEYPDTDLIIFDEFILEKGYQKYLDNEVIKLYGFMDSIFRNRDGCRCICLANSISWVNPYFTFFKFVPMKNGFQVAQSGEVLLNVYENKEFSDMRNKTRLAKLVEGTAYEDMAFKNEFEDMNEDFIKQRPKDSILYLNIIWKKNTYGVWYSETEGTLTISHSYNKDMRSACYSSKDYKPNMMIITDKKIYFNQELIRAFKNGYLYFEDMYIRNDMYDLLSLMGIK